MIKYQKSRNEKPMSKMLGTKDVISMLLSGTVKTNIQVCPSKKGRVPPNIKCKRKELTGTVDSFNYTSLLNTRMKIETLQNTFGSKPLI